MSITKKSTVGMTREEWLAERRKTIGGSDAAAVVGLSKWATPLTVYLDKRGELPDKEDNEAMRLGRDLEAYVADRWCEATGKKVRRVNALLYNDAYPFAHADVDRMVVGENAGLECKTTSALNLRTFQGVEFPEQYYAQCVHYMAVTGADRWYLAVLVFGKGLFTYILDRDEAEIAALMDAEKALWDTVQAGKPPKATGCDADGEALEVIYAEIADGVTANLFGRDSLLEEREVLKRQQKAIGERVDEIDNVLKQDMGAAEKGVCGNYTVRWAQRDGHKTFDADRLHAEHPDLDLSPYWVQGKAYRVFSVKKSA